MAGRIADALKTNGGGIDPAELAFTRALALVHDIGHVPFGHTLEDERPVFPKEHHHDDVQRLNILLKDTNLGMALSKLGKAHDRPAMVDDLIRVMKRTHEEDVPDTLSPREVLFAEIVGNTICADLLDYVARDPIFTGLQHRYDERIISAFNIHEDKIYLDLNDNGDLRHSVASEILHLLRLRYTLGERIYYHPTKAAASAMIAKAVEMSGLSHRSLVSLRDEELLFILENAETFKRALPEEISDAVAVQRIIKKLRARQLYVPAYVITRHSAGPHRQQLVQRFHEYESIQARRRTEESLAKRLGLDPDQIIIYCPHDSMATKPAMVRVRWPKVDQIQALEVLCRGEFGFEDETAGLEIAQLKRKHAALWRMTVFLDPVAIDREDALKALCQDEFFGIADANTTRNYAAQAIKGQLLLKAISEDSAPETVDFHGCLGALEEPASSSTPGLQSFDLSEVRKALPRRSPARQDDDGAAREPHGTRKPAKRSVSDDVGGDLQHAVRRRLSGIMIKFKMPDSQKNNAESLLSPVVEQVCGLPVELRERLFEQLDEDVLAVQSISHNRMTADAFVRQITDRIGDLQRRK
jgi:HD superfamily phosphohydrolase